MKLSKTIARTRSRKNIRGQGMSEYLIIVGLIAVAGIAVMGLFGGTVRNQIGGMAEELAGQANTGQGNAETTAASAATTANTANSLDTYVDQNSRI
ncbi:MAG: hypothetical protein MI867_10475 [Pseudomonadales bacterium]|nr:hypothetical protein [Pseudomonadales bacterium]